MICVCLDFKSFKIAHVTENQILIKMCFKVYVLLFLFLQHGSDSENDLWDDTALIKAYDNAISLVKVRFITY